MIDPQTAQSQPVVPQPVQPTTAQQMVPSDDARPTSVLPQALPQAVIQQADDALNPAQPKPSTTKESGPVLSVEHTTEMPPGVQSVEELRSVELSPEIEKFISEVKEEPDSIPEEIVIADQQAMPLVPPKTLSKPVIVLPITEAELDKSHKEPITSSKRWLGEWLEKVIKLVKGEVVFRQDN